MRSEYLQFLLHKSPCDPSFIGSFRVSLLAFSISIPVRHFYFGISKSRLAHSPCFGWVTFYCYSTGYRGVFPSPPLFSTLSQKNPFSFLYDTYDHSALR